MALIASQYTTNSICNSYTECADDAQANIAVPVNKVGTVEESTSDV